MENLNNILYIRSSLQLFQLQPETLSNSFVIVIFSNSVSDKQFRQTNRHESTQIDARIYIRLDVETDKQTDTYHYKPTYESSDKVTDIRTDICLARYEKRLFDDQKKLWRNN